MSSDNIRTASCFIHRSPPVDTRLLHQHHTHPKGYGGSDDPENLRWLCGSCHDVTHRLAHFIRHNKAGLASDLAYQYQTMQNLSPAGRERLLELANIVATAMASYFPEDVEEDEGNEDDKVIVQLRLPRTMHKRLKAEASKYTNPQSSRQMGLYRYIERVLANHLRVAIDTPVLRQKDEQKFFAGDLNQETIDAPPQAAMQEFLENID